jgi:hypothetical protein
MRSCLSFPGLLSFFCLVLAWPGAVFAVDEAKAKAAIKGSHAPKQPKTGDRVVITLEVSRDVESDSLVLQYQVVEPGKYIALDDPDYAKSWTEVALSKMTRQKTDADRLAFTAELPPELQENRRLIRYRVYSSETKSVVAPVPDDAQQNFAYFVYDGIPAWRGAINPQGSGEKQKVVTFEPQVMRSVQAYHLIAKQPSIENVTWLEPKPFMSPSASEYEYTGTLVADGKVYDHVRFRARGGSWRYAMGKNMWKIDFLKGHHLEARDNWGGKYPKKWGKLNLGACIQHGDYGMRGEQGMNDAVSFRLFNLAGVEASHTHWVQLRIVDAPEESPDDQYQGDFWGLYLAVENVDDEFLEAREMPDGNLYKMDMRGPEPKHIAKDAAADRADVLQFMNGMRRNPDAKWWQTNVDLPRYYSYRSILECVHHYDIMMGKNYFYFRPAQDKRWQVIPWDLDLTWSDGAFGDGGEPFKRAGLLRCEPLAAEYQARLIEIRDLLYNPEQTGALIDEYAAVISHPDGSPSMVDADRAKWDYHPIMSSQLVVPHKTSPGLFYENSPTRDFRGMTEMMKQYVEHRSQWIDQTLLADATLPETPVIAPAKIADASAPTLKLHLASSKPAGKVKWRLAEITDTKKPAAKAKAPGKYEIDALWEAECGATADVSTKDLEKGHTYRIRARVQDGKGRWSHWSAPAQFVP